MKKDVAIIGYGRFGRLAARYLKKHFRVYVADVKKITTNEKGMYIVTIDVAARKDFVILAVPINQLQSVLRSIAPHVKRGSLICDVCSVKELPVQWMKNILPKNVSILGTHPLFGPDSASKHIDGRTLILTPVRIPLRQLRNVKEHLSTAGIRVKQISASGHDKLMAETLFLTQFIGHGLLRFPLLRTSIATQNFELLHHIAVTTGNDSIELFKDMFQYNRFARSIPKRVAQKFLALSRSLNSPKR